LQASGAYQGKLSNAGERLILRKSTGEVIMDLTYDDLSPWPEYADGYGPSMISIDINPEGDPGDYSYWRASTYAHGSPFAFDILLDVEESIEFAEKSSAQVYPNPTHDLLMVQNTLEGESRSTIKIYDIRGSVYFEQEFENYIEVSLSSLNMSTGIYLLEISSQMGKETKKVIYNPR
jgi:hypothetical protein